MKTAVFVTVFLVSNLAVAAQIPGNPDNWCRSGFFTRDSDSFSIGVVKRAKESRVYFHNDLSDNCPEAGACRNKAYLVPGDKVIVNRTRGDFACAWYSPSKGPEAVGWLKASNIDMRKGASFLGIRKWLGEWSYGKNTISFTENKLPGYLNVIGDATWQGIGSNVNVGEIDGRFEPVRGVLEYSDGDGEFDCRAKMRLVGDYLVVADNMNCGGANVTFSGVYSRKKK